MWKRKSFTKMKKYENRSDEPRGAHGDQNQGKAVITEFHSETSESGGHTTSERNDNGNINDD